MNSNPTVKASSSPVFRLAPRSLTKNFCRSGAMSFHRTPFEKPSNDVEPIITHSSATVPGKMSSLNSADSGARMYRASSSSRRSNADTRPNSPK